jgi:hypothetical protein
MWPIAMDQTLFVNANLVLGSLLRPIAVFSNQGVGPRIVVDLVHVSVPYEDPIIFNEPRLFLCNLSLLVHPAFSSQARWPITELLTDYPADAQAFLYVASNANEAMLAWIRR